MYSITRRIDIDAGHRVYATDSHCFHLHGHRYRIEATCTALELVKQGRSQDMVLDFAFLKDEMMQAIHRPCDHSLILSKDDPFLKVLVPEWHVRDCVDHTTVSSDYGIVYVIENSPTAEVLAEHWFNRLSERVKVRSDNLATLQYITVWETPNCKAVFPTQL